MKLIIDISDGDYKFIKDLQSLILGGRGNCKTIQKNVINAIRNGTPYNPSGDLISREALKNYARKVLYEKNTTNFSLLRIFDEIIDNAPVVDAIVNTIEVKPQGKWIDHAEDYGYAECPFCHELTTCGDSIDELHYCWNCGAKLGKGGAE